MLLYYITDRTQFAGTERERCAQLLERIAHAAAAGIELIQLREKDLPAREVAQLATAALERISTLRAKTRLLINSRIDVTLAVGAHGVHLTGNDLSVSEARAVCEIAERAGLQRKRLLIGASCHSIAEVQNAKSQGANFVVLAPIFEKIVRPTSARPDDLPTGEKPMRLPGIGCDMLRQATSTGIQVLALGGVNLSNAKQCLAAGASGIAGIRLFQQGDLEATVLELRAL